jgi:fructan beta-fructosidase
MHIKSIKHITLFLILILGLGCQSDTKNPDTESTKTDTTTVMQNHYKERFRPQFHYTSKINWFNDPNGLIKHKDIYHMYYQYNPKGTQWGNMSWGHATSKDLIHWEEHKVAINMTDDMIFSGTTAIDSTNDSGLCETQNCIVAAYTSFEYELDENENINAIAQHQSIAVSHDDGYSFEHYESNPVLNINSKEFRDPKIFKHDDEWIMLVSLADQHKIAFYKSRDLKSWSEVSQFGNLGDTSSVWECPDLFPLKHNGETKWVLTLSAGHPQGNKFYAMQYFIGDFDGTSFTPDALNYPRYLDFGKDFYAGITFANMNTDDYATMIGWLGCHVYTKDTPTKVWRGAMSLPRELRLERINEQLHLVGNVPTEHLNELVDSTWEESEISVDQIFKIPLNSEAYIVEFEIPKTNNAGIEILSNGESSTKIGYNPEMNKVYLDRTASGNVDFNEKFPSVETAPLISDGDSIKFKIFVDHSLLEVFVNDGETMITDRVFPLENSDNMSLFAENAITEFKNVSIQTLKSIW